MSGWDNSYQSYDNNESSLEWQSGAWLGDMEEDETSRVTESEPLTRFNSSNGSSNTTNTDLYFSSTGEQAYTQGSPEQNWDPSASVTTQYWSPQADSHGMDPLHLTGAQFTQGVSPVDTRGFSSTDAYQTSNNGRYANLSVGSSGSWVDTSYLDPSGMPDQQFQSSSAPYISSSYDLSPLLSSPSGSLQIENEEMSTFFDSPLASPNRRRPRRSPSPYDKPRKNKRDAPVICLAEGCNAKPFGRRADLERHYKQIHSAEEEKKSFFCDYARCERHQKPFHRLDHFREHLREFHREDIDKRGVSFDKEWYNDRNTQSHWWRCNKCLGRINIDKHGFVCPKCRSECHKIRQEIRRH